MTCFDVLSTLNTWCANSHDIRIAQIILIYDYSPLIHIELCIIIISLRSKNYAL